MKKKKIKSKKETRICNKIKLMYLHQFCVRWMHFRGAFRTLKNIYDGAF